MIFRKHSSESEMQMRKFGQNQLTVEDQEAAEEALNDVVRENDLQQRLALSYRVHENLLRFRVRRKLTKQRMAELMEVTPRSYYAYEKGQRPIPSDALVRLAILTGGDLNEILLGRPARHDGGNVKQLLENFRRVLEYLERAYPKMDEKTRVDIAHRHTTTDWDGLPSLSPAVIQDFVKMLTRYRFHPEDLPPPPTYENYEGDDEAYEKAMAAWEAMAEEG